MFTPADESRHTYWMRLALQQAREAAAAGEVPVGAVVVQHGPEGDVLLAQAHNRTLADHDPSAHAEVLALRAAARQLGNHRLHDCSLYVTVEPCSMCSGAVFQARLRQVVYGCAEPKMGAAGSVLNLYANSTLNHHTQIAGGVLAGECAALMQGFFATQRQRNQQQQRQNALRDDALRTPARCFSRCDPPAPEGHCTDATDTPALQGLRLHWLDNHVASDADVPLLLCLHPLWHWGAYWHELLDVAAQAGVPALAPDLPGWGRSDKPKKMAWHTPAVHGELLAQWLCTHPLRQPGQPVVLLAQGLNLPLALALARHPAVADAVAGVLLRDSPEIEWSADGGWSLPVASQRWMQALAQSGKCPDWSQPLRQWLPDAAQQTDPMAWAWLNAPFPDAGHLAGPRSLSGWFASTAAQSDGRVPVWSLPSDRNAGTVWHNLLAAAHALCGR